jgi:Tol biopolymer transport system component
VTFRLSRRRRSFRRFSGSGAEGLLFSADITGSYEIYVSDAFGNGWRQLTNDPTRDNWWPISDGTWVYYCSTPDGVHDTDPTAFEQMTVRKCRLTDGGGDVQVLGLPSALDASWTRYGHPELSPDGTKLVCFVRTNTPLYALVEFNASTGASTRVARSMGAGDACVDPSYSPDGSKIIFAEAVAGVPKISTVLATGATNNGYTALVSGTVGVLGYYDPYYSPDGTKCLALAQTGAVDGSHPLGQWSLKKFTSAGASVANLINDGNVNGKAAFIDNNTVVFHRWEYPLDSIYPGLWRINYDGTGLTEILARGEYPNTNLAA